MGIFKSRMSVLLSEPKICCNERIIPAVAPKMHSKFGIMLANLLFLLNMTDDMAAAAYEPITAKKRTEISKNNLKAPKKIIKQYST